MATQQFKYRGGVTVSPLPDSPPPPPLPLWTDLTATGVSCQLSRHRPAVRMAVASIGYRRAFVSAAPVGCCILLYIISSVASSSAPVRQFELGSLHRYTYESTVLLNEVLMSSKVEGTATPKDVGYQVSAKVQVASVWQSPADPSEKLLQIKLESPSLHIKSRKAPAPEGFIGHKSGLEGLENAAFLVHWRAGLVEAVFVANNEPLSMVNLKRGVASLFQFRMLDVEIREDDVSGNCEVWYRTVDDRTFSKNKRSCTLNKATTSLTHPDKVFGTKVISDRQATYVFRPDLSVLESIVTQDHHEMAVALRKEAGGSVQAVQELKITDDSGVAKPVKGSSAEEVVKIIAQNLGVTLERQTLALEREPPACQDDCPTVAKLLNENRAQLQTKNLGTFKSALAFLRVIPGFRAAKKDELIKLLKSSKNQDIMPQLLDLAAAAQTLPAHGAVMKVIDFTSETEIDLPERYLWSLTYSSHPLEPVIKEILKKSEEGVPSAKLSETLTLTAAAMTHKWLKLQGNAKRKLKDDVRDSILQRLSACQSEDCKQIYIRAIKNLGTPDLVPTLLNLVTSGTKKTTVAAMKALYGLPSTYWDTTVRDTARRVFLQLGRRYDSSARTLAADLLLEAGPTRAELLEVVSSLSHAVTRDSQEVGQYVLQRIRQLGEKDVVLRTMFKDVLRQDDGRLNTYHVLAQRGMASAFTREFLSTASSNGSLVSTLELAGGLLKRSTLDVVLEGAEDAQAIFTLGMFAGGLSSFISSDEEATPAGEGEEEEAATAGMELTVLGAGVRPFVFFSGQGELMGLVWSGAGSERTPAYQAILPLQEHLQLVPLQSGFVAELSLRGALSFELAGEVQLSLWNRNAHSVVEKNAGVALQGVIRVDPSFVRSQVEFTLATEPRLNLVSDVNFYNKVALCLQLKQPDTIVKHNIHKVERIPGSKHRLRKSKYRIYEIPGKTYALNAKNNEMCSAIFQE